jgi:hypothetical protein
VHKKFSKIESGEKEGGFVAENDYVAADGTVVMSDTRTVRFLAPTDAMGPRILDITIKFHASNGPVTFGDQKDAGMAIRVASDLQVEKRTNVKDKMLPATGHLLNSEGVKDKDTWGKRAKWVDYYGTVKGDVRATERVELGPKARVIGNVQYKLIEMSIGAEVNGKLIHESEHGAAKSASRPQVDTTRPVNAGE